MPHSRLIVLVTATLGVASWAIFALRAARWANDWVRGQDVATLRPSNPVARLWHWPLRRRVATFADELMHGPVETVDRWPAH